MRKTPKEIAESSAPERVNWISDATTEEIWQLLPHTPFPSHDFQTAITRLDILISKELSKIQSQISEVRKDISRVETSTGQFLILATHSPSAACRASERLRRR